MKRTDYLITLGETWKNKYASVDANSIRPQIENHIKESLKNAAGSNAGLLNFPVMIKSDGATLNLIVTRNDTLGFKNIKASNLEVYPSNLTTKYQPLVGQVEKYLNKNWELFPSMHDGESVDYSNFAINLTYKPEDSGEMIAGD